jgi:hypothetical protein
MGQKTGHRPVSSNGPQWADYCLGLVGPLAGHLGCTILDNRNSYWAVSRLEMERAGHLAGCHRALKWAHFIWAKITNGPLHV